jgi:hypothetical protein
LRYIPTPPKKKSQRNPSQTTWYYLLQNYEISLRYPKTSWFIHGIQKVNYVD